MTRTFCALALAFVVYAAPAWGQIVPPVIPAEAAITVPDGSDARIGLFDCRAYESVTLIIRNVTRIFTSGRVDVAVTGGTAAPALADIDWAPLNATDHPTITTLATLNVGLTTYVTLDTHGIQWIQAVAQCTGGTSTAVVQFSGVPRSN